jgi:excisionase family DNA binding protein
MEGKRQPLRLVDATGVAADLGKNVTAQLHRLLALISEGHSVSILPTEVPLTTQAAADILNVSRQYLVRLLDNGTIPSRRTGTHRRILLKDVVAYKQKRDDECHEALDALTVLSKEYGGYGELES